MSQTGGLEPQDDHRLLFLGDNCTPFPIKKILSKANNDQVTMAKTIKHLIFILAENRSLQRSFRLFTRRSLFDLLGRSNVDSVYTDGQTEA